MPDKECECIVDELRELDAKIAEKVMKLRYVRRVSVSGYVTLEVATDSGGYIVPHYSSDIAAAWEVVMKIPMSVSAPNAPFADGEYANNGSQWKAEAVPSGAKFHESVSAYADTAPLAICLAALKTMETKGKK